MAKPAAATSVKVIKIDSNSLTGCSLMCDNFIVWMKKELDKIVFPNKSCLNYKWKLWNCFYRSTGSTVTDLEFNYTALKAKYAQVYKFLWLIRWIRYFSNKLLYIRKSYQNQRTIKMSHIHFGLFFMQMQIKLKAGKTLFIFCI